MNLRIFLYEFCPGLVDGGLNIMDNGSSRHWFKIEDDTINDGLKGTLYCHLQSSFVGMLTTFSCHHNQHGNVPTVCF